MSRSSLARGLRKPRWQAISTMPISHTCHSHSARSMRISCSSVFRQRWSPTSAAECRFCFMVPRHRLPGPCFATPTQRWSQSHWMLDRSPRPFPRAGNAGPRWPRTHCVSHAVGFCSQMFAHGSGIQYSRLACRPTVRGLGTRPRALVARSRVLRISSDPRPTDRAGHRRGGRP